MTERCISQADPQPFCTRTYLNPKDGLWSKAGRLLGRFGTRRKTGGTFESVRRAWRRGRN